MNGLKKLFGGASKFGSFITTELLPTLFAWIVDTSLKNSRICWIGLMLAAIILLGYLVIGLTLQVPERTHGILNIIRFSFPALMSAVYTWVVFASRDVYRGVAKSISTVICVLGVAATLACLRIVVTVVRNK